MVLTPQEESLIAVVRSLPPQETERIAVWASQPAAAAKGLPLEWSDSWSEEDMADARAASMRQLEQREMLGD
jgi:hypothetical protein